MSTPSLGGGATRSVQVVLGANAAPAVAGLRDFSRAATEAGKTAERAALQAKAAQDRQAKASSDAARVVQAASAKAAEAQLKAVQAAQAHARATAAGSKQQADAAKAAAAAAKLSAQEQAASARLVRVEQQRAATAAVAAARQAAVAAREASAQQVAAARAVAAAQRQAAAQQAAHDRAHATAVAENARRQIAAQRAAQAAARQAAAEQAAFDRAHGAAIAENARRNLAALRAQQAAARQAAAAQAVMDRLHGQAIAENARREAAARAAATAALRQQAAAQAAMDRAHAAAIAENARRTAAANAAALAGQRRLGQQMANDLRRQRDLDRQQQDALDENARRDEERQRKRAGAQKKVGGALTGAGAVAGLGVLVSVAAAAQLEQAISRVQAATGVGINELAKLRAAAIEAGEATQYSSVEAAQGIEELAKAGLSATDILGGGLTAALNLAAADGLAVGDAAEYIATTLNQFSLAGGDATHVADLLAAAAGEASGNVSDAALALSYIGPVAAGAHIPIEEVVGSIALLSKNGILAEKAGTGLRGTILALTSPSAKAAEEMAGLGLHLYDAENNFVGIRGAAEQLQIAFGGLTQEQRDYSLGVIFGNNQVTAANILLKSGAQGVDAMTAAVNDQGRAAEMASTRTDNLVGDLERLGGALNSALVGTGDGGLAPLRVLTQGLTGVVSGYNDLSNAGKGTVLVVASVGSAAALAGGAFLLLAPRIIATRLALATLVPAGSRARGALIGVGKAAGALGGLTVAALAIGQIEKATRGAAPGIEATTEALLGLNGAAGDSAIDNLFKTNLLDNFDDALNKLADPSRLDKVANVTSRIITLGQSDERGTSQAKDRFEQLDQALSKLVSGGSVDQAESAFERLAGRAQAAGVSVVELRGLLPAYVESLKGVQNASVLSAEGTDTLGTSLGDTTGEMDDERTAAERLRDALDLLNGGAISVTESQIAFRNAQRDGAKSLEDSAKAAKNHQISLNANTKAGGENLDTILGQIKAAEDYAEAVTAQAEATTDEVTAQNRGRTAYARRIEDLRKTWKEAGLTNAQIDALIKKYAQLPAKASTEVDAPGALEAARQADDVKTSVLSIPDQFRTGVFLNDQATPFLPGIESKLDTLTRPRVIDIRTYFRPAPIPAGVAAPVGPRAPGRAEGGPIPGPFVGPKADNVLIAATPREYMQPVAAHDYYGTAAMDAIRRRAVPREVLRGYADGGEILGYAGGGPIRGIDAQAKLALAPGAAAGDIAVAARELQRLAQAWRDANEAAEQAGERAKLVREEAKAARVLAKANAKERAEAKKAHREAVAALAEFDKAAKQSRLEASVAGKEQRAQNRAEYEFGKLSEEQQLASVKQRLKAEKLYSDEWLALARQRDDLESSIAEKRAAEQQRAAEETNRQADESNQARDQGVTDATSRLNDLLDERDGIVRQLAEAQKTYDKAVQQANEGLAQQTAQIVASRAEALSSMDLTKRASTGTGLSVASLVKNARSQVEAFTAFAEQLDLARARGLSEDVIKTLDLERGPEALAQLRKLNQGAAEDIATLNGLVGQQITLAGQRAQNEAAGGVGAVGRDIATARTEAQAAIDAANADLIASQTQLNADLASVGQGSGRDFATAVSQGMLSGIPGIQDAYRALQGALAVPIAAKVTVTPVPGLANGGTVPGPFIGARADNVLATVAGGGHVRVTPGEHITPVPQARKYAPLLDAIRADRVPGYADGGYVHGAHMRTSGSGGTSVRADVDTYALQMEVRAVAREVSYLTGTVRDGQRERSIVGSSASW